MSHTLITGLGDLSAELGETSTNKTSARIKHYNDAVVDFANEKKWSFLVAKDTSLTTENGTKSYNIPISVKNKWRAPGAVKEITIGASTVPILPISWDERNDAKYSGNNHFYVDPEENQITFTKDITSQGEVITIYFWYIPDRLADPNDLTSVFPIPDRYRKVISTLAAAYVQWSRYLDGQGNRLFNLYNRMIGKAGLQQAELHRGQIKRFPNLLAWRGYKRIYPK